MVIMFNDPYLQKQTTLYTTEVTHWVGRCVKATIFAFRYCLLVRTGGSPMGWPVSPLLNDKQTIDTYGRTLSLNSETRLNQMQETCALQKSRQGGNTT